MAGGVIIAAKRLKDRDTWIGWDAVTCGNRLKLVVQLRRFVVPQEARRPNLASQCLGQPYTLPEEHRKGIAETTCGARSALNCKPLRSLKDAFKQVDDPRNPCNRRHPLSALLAMRTYSGKKNDCELPVSQILLKQEARTLHPQCGNC